MDSASYGISRLIQDHLRSGARLAGALAFASSGLFTIAAAPAPSSAPDSIIVVLKDGIDPRAVASEHAGRHGASIRYVYSTALTGYAARASSGAMSAIAADGRVAYVERDAPVSINTTQSGATWGLDRIDQTVPLASGDTTFDYTYSATGAGTRAYIIDTGILSSHEQFGQRVVSGTSSINDGRGTTDCNGHGTHVAGTVGGATYGVAKGVTLVPVRVLDCAGSGTWSGVIAGIDWVAANHVKGTPAVANLSLGGGASTAVDDAVRKLIGVGVATAVAAGNGNQAGVAQDACRTSPARVTEAMTVSATDRLDAKASWANYGTCVDWFAPGVAVTSAWIDGNAAANTISGTSMATPHTAGVAALYLQTNPTASPATVRDALHNATSKRAVKSSRTVNNNLLFTNY